MGHADRGTPPWNDRCEMAATSNLSLSDTGPSQIRLALKDLLQGLNEWRIWWILGTNDIRQRYRRSVIGQFWTTISMAATILGIALVYGVIFDQPIQDYIL